MNTIEPRTLKGFRDFLPQEARKRNYVVETLKKVFEAYGLEPLETPVLEYEDILAGKYGDEGESSMYRFEDRGGRKVAMRYDQTVPLARVVAQYQNEIPMPFKRYQIQSVWRAENTQKGRYREFMQCDADIVGTHSSLADAEVINIAINSVEKLGFKNYKVLINDRDILFGIKIDRPIPEDKMIKVIIALDKLKKIGKEGVLKEIEDSGFSREESIDILHKTEYAEETLRLKEVFENLEKLGLTKDKYEFVPVLARGLNYYTGTIFEIEVEGYSAGSVCGGGRYDNLVGMFKGEQVPATGFAFGFDRLIEAMDELNLFPEEVKRASAKVLVTVFNEDLLQKSIEISSRLRSNNISTELWLDTEAKLDRQIKYADRRRIPFVIIIGPDEASNNTATVKNLVSGEQKTISLEELSNVIS
jgi:histidyl-tRNA synthetase